MTLKTVQLWVHMQRLFSTVLNPWMMRLLPAVEAVTAAIRSATVFTRLILRRTCADLRMWALLNAARSCDAGDLDPPQAGNEGCRKTAETPAHHQLAADCGCPGEAAQRSGMMSPTQSEMMSPGLPG